MDQMPPIPSQMKPAATPAPAPQRNISVGLKILFMALITLGLMIPDLIIYSMSDDRQDTSEETVRSISKGWGGSQTISGPILSIPYRYKVNGADETGTVKLLPSSLDANAAVDSRTISRSIYEATVYTSDVSISGDFNLTELAGSSVPLSAMQLQNAVVTIGIGDLKGLESVSELKMGPLEAVLNGANDRELYVNRNKGGEVVVVTEDTEEYASESYEYNDYWDSGRNSNNGCLQANVDLSGLIDTTSAAVPFSATVRLKGSQSLAFTPVGRESVITVGGSCKTPSFGGMFLPSDRSVSGGNFEAVWRLNSNNRDYPQLFTGDNASEIAQSAVVVNMLVPVDRYQKVDRSLKYAFLVIMLTFVTILFCEIMARTPMYMFQYLLIGLALILFYSLLLSLVEHTSFGLSYLISAVMVIGMVTVYLRAVLRKNRMALLTGCVLALMYGFIYVLMCMETYALLTGSIGLFIALAAVMYASLKIKTVNSN